MHAYETDFSAWAEEQAQAIIENRLSELDLANIAEEIASLSASQKSALRSQIRRLIMHLLKWQEQPYDRSFSWLGSISDVRTEIEDLLKVSPSLRNTTSEIIGDVYRGAVRKASEETGIEEKDFPKECPFTFEELMEFPVSRKDIQTGL